MVAVHYRGRFSGNPDDLVKGAPHPTATLFKEIDSMAKLGLVANGLAFVILALLFVGTIFLFGWGDARVGLNLLLNWWSLGGMILALAVIIPHEFLHAICFPHDAYIYSDLRHGLFFAYSPDPISKGRFLFMSALPNLVFGLVPFVIGAIIRGDSVGAFLAMMGVLSLAAGAGDYINMANASFQVPHGALVYMTGFRSAWYRPKDEEAYFASHSAS